MALSSGCAPRSIDQAQPGITTESQRNDALGPPVGVVNARARREARLLFRKDGCIDQIERGILVGLSCPPLGSEVSLQYWRHQWIGQTQRFEPLPESENSHGQRRYQLASQQAGMAVIYDEATERVLRVVKYEKR